MDFISTIIIIYLAILFIAIILNSKFVGSSSFDNFCQHIAKKLDLID